MNRNLRRQIIRRLRSGKHTMSSVGRELEVPYGDVWTIAKRIGFVRMPQR